MSLTGTEIATLQQIATTVGESSAPLDIQLIAPTDLCGSLADRWKLLRGFNTNLDSPYFDIEFTRAVARVRDDVEIAVFRKDDQVAGFLPFQRVTPTHGEPVGGRLNDWHGFVAMPNLELSVTDMLAAADLQSLGFHAMVNTTPDLESFSFRKCDTHHLDMSDGYDAYWAWVRKHSSTIKRQGQKTRGMERDHGEVRFEFDCTDPSVLEELIQLKRAKYQRSKTFDILSVNWATELLREIHDIRKSNFKGLLSVLWAGDQVVAVHFGLLTEKIVHYWFPVFNPAFGKYSPGTELMLRVAQEANSLGVTKLDLGYGDDDYKFKFANGKGSVLCGQANPSQLQFKLAKKRYELRNKLKGIPLKAMTKRILRKVYPNFGQHNFR